MSLKKEFAVAVAAGQTAICIRTDEQPDALSTLSETCQKYNWAIRVWDRTYGLRRADNQVQPPGRSSTRAAAPIPNQLSSPLLTGVLDEFLKEAATIDRDGKPLPVVLVVRNFQIVSDRVDELFSVIQHLAEDGKEQAKYIVVLVSSGTTLPPLLAPIFYTIEHELPDEAELGTILDGCLRSDQDKPALTPDARRAVIKAALGLNRMQADGAFALSMQRHGEILPAVVWKYKVKQLNDEGLIEIYEGSERFAQVGGLQGAKDFLISLLTYDDFDRDDPAVRSRGVIMLGSPGVGKSLLAACLGNETCRPVLKINVGRLMGSLMGQTENQTRRMFDVVRKLAPCLAVIDEFGKQMPSTTNKNNDSGVSARLAGEFLTQMNDITEDVFWCFTDNAIEHVDPGFTRAERLDAKIYVKIPGPAQRATCWRIYFTKFFPAEINKKKYPHYINLDIEALLDEFQQVKKPDLAAWGHKLAPALMCLAGQERKHAKNRILDVDDSLASTAEAALIDDTDWTPAEIRACVRLMRRLKRTLADAQNVVGHIAKGDAKRIKAIEDWCVVNGALDAETGKLFELTVEDNKQVADAGKRRRRHIIDNTEPEDN